MESLLGVMKVYVDVLAGVLVLKLVDELTVE